MSSQVQIAIIGAGVSGLAAAHTLLDAGYTVTLFEKDQQVGGRANTRSRAGFIYDPGAQHIKRGDASSVRLITERFRTPELIDISKPVWIFNAQGKIEEGDPRQNAEPKWSYRSGLRALSLRMAVDLTIHLQTPITHIRQGSAGNLSLYTSDGAHVGDFARLLLAIPPNEALSLMQQSSFAQEIGPAICSYLTRARYNPLLSVMLGYRPRPALRPYYALVNPDKGHPISWLAWEHEKAPERAPQDSGLLIAQMAPPYSTEHLNASDQELLHDVAQRVATLIDEPLPAPCFTDIVRWPLALPAATADAHGLNALTLPYGLAFCGDGYVGGRLHLAIEHGIMVARQLASK
ncbi:FAD-dependent oxidoreductase [Ktedonosporobacter rubrisoli]|uniref:FAD-dependent oxidoreductase n=1 Tax=Ktedonosporobacter rubrisoli TaxID=2509675 RepID=A0A4P6K140_KTERU|nr:FAD-dependent oxidoreductase [Ktedonosporobacter rubrisoli]QBD81867.1 FAD-dependent oxidoreductase [Ktedonosporobacter rubrisoli]